MGEPLPCVAGQPSYACTWQGRIYAASGTAGCPVLFKSDVDDALPSRWIQCMLPACIHAVLGLTATETHLVLLAHMDDTLAEQHLQPFPHLFVTDTVCEIHQYEAASGSTNSSPPLDSSAGHHSTINSQSPKSSPCAAGEQRDERQHPDTEEQANSVITEDPANDCAEQTCRGSWVFETVVPWQIYDSALTVRDETVIMAGGWDGRKTVGLLVAYRLTDHRWIISSHVAHQGEKVSQDRRKQFSIGPVVP